MASEVAEYLSTTIGERRSGTEADRKAAEYVGGKMKELGLAVEYERFKFLGWEMTRPSRLELLGPEQRELPCGVFRFSESTPEGGITGKVEYMGTMYVVPRFFEWPKYVIKAPDGSDLGYIVVHKDGRAISFTLIDMGKTYGCMPYIITDHETHNYFQAQLAAGKEIHVRMDTAGKLMPGLETQNVIGTLKGSALPQEEIVICAHYDSTYSPGANDNASGVDAMIKVAKALVEKGGTKKTVKFIAFGAEEYLLLGSYYHVQTLKERGHLGRIKNVINLDMVGKGEYLWTWVSPESFRQQVASAFDKTIKDEFKIQWSHELFPASDHWPFFVEKIPSVLLIFWPDDNYHQDADSFDKIQDDTIEKAAKAATAIAELVAGGR